MAVDVRDVEHVVVRPAGKAELQHFAHRRVRPIASREPRALARLFARGRLEPRGHAGAAIVESNELGLALDRDAEFRDGFDEELFLLVLREDQHEREGALVRADVSQHGAAAVLAARPHVDGGELHAARDRLVGEPERAVELERARVHDEGARGRSRGARLVDDAHGDAAAGEPQGEHQSRWPGADDEDLGWAIAHSYRTRQSLSGFSRLCASMAG